MKSVAILGVATLAFCGALHPDKAGAFHSPALLSLTNVTQVAAKLKTKELNPQPLPPKVGLNSKINEKALNPQPLPPKVGKKVLHPGDPIKPAKAKAKVLKLKNG